MTRETGRARGRRAAVSMVRKVRTDMKPMRTRLLSAAVVVTFALACAAPRAADAAAFVRITDASVLAYQTEGSAVYLRNLNQFDSNALGCCYNYYIDTSSQEGKNLFALLLMAIATHGALWLGVPDGYAAGVVGFAGNW